MKRDDDLSEARTDNFQGVLKEIFDAIGEKDTLTLIGKHGGIRLWVPTRMKEDHPLAELLGMQSAQKLAAIFGGQDHFDIPLHTAYKRARRNAQIYADHAGGMSVSAIARKHQTTERNIRLIFAARLKPQSSRSKKSIEKPINRSV